MSWRQRAERILTTSRGALGLGTNVALLVIMFAVSLDAVLRYALSQPIAGVLEGVELEMQILVGLDLVLDQEFRLKNTMEVEEVHPAIMLRI